MRVKIFTMYKRLSFPVLFDTILQLSTVNNTSHQAIADLRTTVQLQAGVISQQANEISLLKIQVSVHRRQTC
jgi:hypothetical protein